DPSGAPRAPPAWSARSGGSRGNGDRRGGGNPDRGRRLTKIGQAARPDAGQSARLADRGFAGDCRLPRAGPSAAGHEPRDVPSCSSYFGHIISVKDTTTKGRASA